MSSSTAEAPSADARPAAGAPWTRLRKALGRVRRAFTVDTFDVFARPVAGMGFSAPEGYVVRWAEPDDIAGADPYHTELDELERAAGVRRLELGHRAVVALAGDTVVFSMWVNPRNLNVPGDLKRALAPDQWFIYKAFTSPDHRGRKLYQAGMRFVLAEMARAGLRELVGYAHVKKAVSRSGLARLDFEGKGRYRAVRFPGWHRTLVSRELARSFPEVVPRSGAVPPRAEEGERR